MQPHVMAGRYPQFTANFPGKIGNDLLGFLKLDNDLFGARKQNAARLGELNGFADTIKEACT